MTASSGPLFLGIDVGTTTIKAALVDLTGAVVASASRSYPTSYVRPDWVEQNPLDWWQVTQTVLAELRSTVALDRVAGIAVSSQAPSLVALDDEGVAVRPALIWMDRRAEPQCAELAAVYGQAEYLRRFGNRIDPFFVAPKIMWFRENEPQHFERTRWFAQINGYIVLRLTGEISLDDQHASLYALRAPGDDSWSAEALNMVGISASQLPPVSKAHEIVGTVTPGIARLTGLPEGVPVVAGTVDSAASAIEVDALEPGSATEMTGTSTVLVLPSADPRPSEAFITMSSPRDGTWLTLAATVASGASLNWIRGIIAPAEEYTAVIETASTSAPGAGGVIFVPHMMGERSPIWDTASRGTFTGMSLATTPADLARAVLEGTSFSVRHNLVVAAEARIAPQALHSTGAPSSSDIWCQIKADVTDLPIIRMKSSVGAAYGDALLAAVGTGHADSLSSFGGGVDRVDRVFTPGPALRSLYSELFDSYLELTHAVRPIHARIHGILRKGNDE